MMAAAAIPRSARAWMESRSMAPPGEGQVSSIIPGQ